MWGRKERWWEFRSSQLRGEKLKIVQNASGASSMSVRLHPTKNAPLLAGRDFMV